MPCRMPGSNVPNSISNMFLGLEPGYCDDTALWRASWNWERRGIAASAERNNYTHLWPRTQFMNVDLPLPCDRDRNDNGSNPFEPFIVGLPGTQSTKFILGTCRDTRGQPVAGATVDAFLTASDVKVGAATSFADGTYAVGTDNPISAQHYLVAYLAGSPDIAGTTVNTLTPTNIDGT
jgi:hypothetical protein